MSKVQTAIALLQDAEDCAELLTAAEPGVEKIVKALKPYGRLLKDLATEFSKGAADIQAVTLSHLKRKRYSTEEALQLMDMALRSVGR